MACPAMWAVAPATGGSAPGCLPSCVSRWEKSERDALFFSGTTGGGPRWDQVIWRRTVDVNGTVIEDIGVNSSDRRVTLFRRLPRRSDTKTIFWYCDDAEVYCPGGASTSRRVPVGNLSGSRFPISLMCLLSRLRMTIRAGS